MGSFDEFDREFFKRQFCKSDQQIEHVEKIINCTIKEFYDNYKDDCYKELEKIVDDLKNNQLKSLQHSEYVNSMKIRIKEPYHFIDKLVRKVSKEEKYKDITLSNYRLYFDDLIGCRLIVLYLEDCISLHKEIVSVFPLIENAIKEKPREDEPHKIPEIISPVEVNIRNGDDEEIFKPITDKHGPRKGRYYRSIHYTIGYKEYCLELQVRSIYDEAWGEVDHNILYPKFLDNKKLIEYSKMLNRITGASNELASYFKNVLCDVLCENPAPKPTLKTVPDELSSNNKTVNVTGGVVSKACSGRDVIKNITNGDKI